MNYNRVYPDEKKIDMPKWIAWLIPVTLFCGMARAADWPQSLYLGNGGCWHQRIRLDVRNAGNRDALGLPVNVAIGPGPGRADLAGVNAESVRVVDADGVEQLYAIYDASGRLVKRGPIPDGAVLTVPATCPANGSTSLRVYFNNPLASAVPDFLNASTDVRNSGVEDGTFASPAGWTSDAGDPQHVASWVQGLGHNGTHSLALWVAPGAEPSWISTRQTGIFVNPGAHYVLRGWVKAANVDSGGYAGWYIHVGTAAAPMLLNRIASAGGGSYDWKEVRLEFDAPSAADRAELGTALWGTGTAWFDDVNLESATAPDLTAIPAARETLSITETGTTASWYEGIPGSDIHWEYRVPLRVINTGSMPLSGLAQVDLSPLLERKLGIVADSARVVDGPALVPHYLIGRTLLFEAQLTARTVHTYYLYLSTDGGIGARPGSDYGGLMASDRNLVQNPSFESGNALPAGWDPGSPPAGVTLSLDSPGLFGDRAARITVPAGTPLGSWPGWHQDTSVLPGASYFYGAWLKTQDIADGSVGIYAHYLTAAREPSKYSQFADAGPYLSGTAGWTLLSGTFTMPPDCAYFQLHLTVNAYGTVWHDGVLLTQAIPSATGALETRSDAPGISVWPVNALIKVFRDDPVPLHPGQAKISAARNEYEPLQLAIRSTTAISGVKLEVDAPANEMGARLSDVQVSVAGYVPIDHPSGYYQSSAPEWQRRYPVEPGQSDGWQGWWPDPLLPTDVFDLLPGRTQPVWITVRVPKGAVPGDYRGTVRLTSPVGELQAIPFIVHVYKFTLPDERHLAAVYDVRLNGWWGTQARSSLEAFMSQHRLSPDRIYPDPAIQDANGKLSVDFDSFDVAADRYFNELKLPHTYTPGDFYAFGWGMPPASFAGQNPYPGTYPYADADRGQLRPEYKTAYQSCLRAYWEHMKAKGWESKVVLYLADEPDSQDPRIIAQLKALAAMVHEVDHAIPIYVSTWVYVPEWERSIDIWGLGHYGGVSPEQMKQIRAKGHRIRFTTDGQMCIDTPYLAVERLLPYYSWKYGVEGYEFWGFTWLMDYDPYEFGWFPYLYETDRPDDSFWVRYPNGDGFLAYPGAPIGYDGPVASLRSEQAREGAEDYEYLRLLKEYVDGAKSVGIDASRGEAALARAEGVVAIPNAGGKASSSILPDPDAVFAAREEVASALESFTEDEMPSPRRPRIPRKPIAPHLNP